MFKKYIADTNNAATTKITSCTKLNASKFVPLICNARIANKIITTKLDSELKIFSNHLKRAGIDILKLGITFMDDNFINLIIITNESENISSILAHLTA